MKYSEWLDGHLNFIERRLTDLANETELLVGVLQATNTLQAAQARALERIATAIEIAAAEKPRGGKLTPKAAG